MRLSVLGFVFVAALPAGAGGMSALWLPAAGPEVERGRAAVDRWQFLCEPGDPRVRARWTPDAELSGGDSGRAHGRCPAGRHFDKSGRKIGSAIPQAGFTEQELGDPRNQLATSANRIAWLCPLQNRYVELTIDGVVRMNISSVKFQAGEEVGALIPMDDGRVFGIRRGWSRAA